jgi:hypothetical protein
MLLFASLSTTELAPEDVVTPVPPLATASVPLSVTAPVEAVEGVKPVDPALKEETDPDPNDDQVTVVPLDVNTYPFAPIANLAALLVPFPTIRSPVEVIGDSALNALVAVVCPVPPLAILSVPPSVTTPLVAVAGVKPVDPPLNVLTAGAPAVAIAAVVVLTVCPFWTIGTISLPVIAAAAGNWVIVTCADITLGSVDLARSYPNCR